MDVNYSLKIKNEALVLEVNGAEVSPLKEVMANLFALPGLGTMQFSTNKDGKITDFRLAAGRVKNLIFEKK